MILYWNCHYKSGKYDFFIEILFENAVVQWEGLFDIELHREQRGPGDDSKQQET